LIVAAGADRVPCDQGDGVHVIHERQPLDLPGQHLDIGLSMHVLEHVWELDEYLGNFRRQLRDVRLITLSTQ
jgi:hypothetical protein